MSKIDETNYSLSQLLANMIKDMLITFPSLIKNESDRFSKKKIMKTFPKHWGFGSKKFSNSHKNKIISTIKVNKTLLLRRILDKLLKFNLFKYFSNRLFIDRLIFFKNVTKKLCLFI